MSIFIRYYSSCSLYPWTTYYSKSLMLLEKVYSITSCAGRCRATSHLASGLLTEPCSYLFHAVLALSNGQAKCITTVTVVVYRNIIDHGFCNISCSLWGQAPYLIKYYICWLSFSKKYRQVWFTGYSRIIGTVRILYTIITCVNVLEKFMLTNKIEQI